MSGGRVLAMAVLTVLAALQFVAVAATLLLAVGTSPSWASLWQQIAADRASVAWLAAILAAVLLGAPTALMLWCRQGKGLAAGLLLAPLLLPVSWFDQTGGGLMLALHASLGFAVGTICAWAGLSSVDPGLLRAAASCGVSPLAAMRRVILPLMAPALLAGALLAGAGSVAASLLTLATRHSAPLPAFSGLALPPVLAAAGMALVLCAVMAAALMLVRRT